ncbi:MAG TPA: amino acid adenylation domain-containing protein, partial [Steroidobacteraceae bacterium]
RWRMDGTLEYLGRNDSQVKIRGFRIELGEIEAHLVRHMHVREAAVFAREDVPGEKRLVAYVIPTHAHAPPTTEQLRAHLLKGLPEYMVPGAFVVLERLPLTPSGKLDRKALPAPALGAYVSRRYEAPQGDVEEILAGIWHALLHVERVGRWDNFFELGGHSLLIVQMMARLHRVGLSAELRRVYESPTLADLSSVLRRGALEPFPAPPNKIPAGCNAIAPQMLPLVRLGTEHIEAIVRSVPGGAANIQDIYPLTPLQEGMLFHHLSRTREDVYALTTVLSVPSRERLLEFVAALEAVIARHDVLRTAVLWEQLPQPVQVVYRQAHLPVQEVALDPNGDSMEQIRKLMRLERQKLDLRQAPLLKLQVMADPRSAPWYVLLQFHHIIDDATSMGLMIREVVARLEGREQGLPEPVPYRNHVAQVLTCAHTHEAEAFFRHELGSVEEPTAPFGILEISDEPDRLEEARERLDGALARRLRARARRLSVSAATLFHAAWALVIAQTSGREDIVFGSVLSGQLQSNGGAQRPLGMLINTLPLRLRLRGVTVEELMEQTQRKLVQLLHHEHASLAMAQRCSGLVGAAPLFSALLNYRHSVYEAAWGVGTGVHVITEQEWTNYPITLSVDDEGEGFALTVQTDRRIDAGRMLAYVSTAILSLVTALEEAPQSQTLALAILPPTERQQVLEGFNATDAAYSAEKLVHELFEEQVERTPHAVALCYEGHRLTYAQLNARANQLAWYLRQRGVAPEHLVGLCVERSLELVVGLLGILKAGGAYVPLDPDHPPERLTFTLKDAAPQVLLLQERLKEKLPHTGVESIALDQDWSRIAQQPVHNLAPQSVGLRPSHLAYVIYTSGSTGKPKGAMNEHRGVVNRLHWMQQQYQLGPHDRVLQKTPFSFDVSVWEFFWTLMSGASLVVARPHGHKDPAYLRNLIEQTGVTRLHFVPSMLQIFLDQHPAGSCSSVRHVVCSGEELPAAVQRKCFECLGQVRLSNLYGPTETAVDVTAWECDRPSEGTRIPIGRPIANTRIYVLDQGGRPVPIGVTGELHIGGIGVGRGYLGRPDLTAERFLPDPFAGPSYARMYKTGDLGRWQPDGALEFLGRNDHQVKIRGFRIELGEIEAQLLSHEGVKEAVVLAREDLPGEQRLVAYVVGRDRSVSVARLRAHLATVLPDYMIPSAVLVQDNLPRSLNGKLDRRALPAPDAQAYVRSRYEAPQGELEQILAGIWQELLHIEPIGRNDNFFSLGGHSL